MKVYSLNGGLYPQRVVIYLAEKGLSNIEVIHVDPPFKTPGAEWPPKIIRDVNPRGTFPVLEVGDGTIIRQSLAILTDLEERFPEPTMIGETAGARALTRELVAIFDEATTFLGIWARFGSRFNARNFKPNLETAQTGATFYLKLLQQAEATIAESEFLNGDTVTIADCVAAATLRLAKEFYGIPVPRECPKLGAWYERFSIRPSIPHAEYPLEILEQTIGLPEQTEFFF